MREQQDDARGEEDEEIDQETAQLLYMQRQKLQEGQPKINEAPKS